MKKNPDEIVLPGSLRDKLCLSVSFFYYFTNLSTLVSMPSHSVSILVLLCHHGDHPLFLHHWVVTWILCQRHAQTESIVPAISRAKHTYLLVFRPILRALQSGSWLQLQNQEQKHQSSEASSVPETQQSWRGRKSISRLHFMVTSAPTSF